MASASARTVYKQRSWFDLAAMTVLSTERTWRTNRAAIHKDLYDCDLKWWVINFLPYSMFKDKRVENAKGSARKLHVALVSVPPTRCDWASSSIITGSSSEEDRTGRKNLIWAKGTQAHGLCVGAADLRTRSKFYSRTWKRKSEFYKNNNQVTPGLHHVLHYHHSSLTYACSGALPTWSKFHHGNRPWAHVAQS